MNETLKLEDLIEGELYTIDKGFANSGTVKLIRVYVTRYCLVEDPETGQQWQTMVYRLSKLDESDLK